VTELDLWLVPAAVVGPATAAAAWLALSPWRWPRRILAGLVATATLTAASWVLSLAYLGRRPEWEGLAPDLLGATAAAVALVGIGAAALEVERRPPPEIPLVVAGLGAAASAVVVAAYTDSLVLLAVAVPIPTLAAVAAAAGTGRRDGRGVVGLALADAAALVGLSVVFDGTDTTAISASTGLGVGLVLAGAAVKAGSVPGLGTARLQSAGSPAGPLAGALRGQAVVLAAVAALAMAGADEMVAVAVVATVVAVGAGVAALLARRGTTILAGSLGVAGAVMFVALGLGGGVGARAFLILFPAFLLAAAAAQGLWADGSPARLTPSGGWGRRLLVAAAVLAGGVVLGSLAGLPLGGGFPGTWLTGALATDRGAAAPAYLLVAGGMLAAVALSAAAGVRLLRAVRPRPAPVVVAALFSVALLYAGAQPVRLGIGWWLRVEDALDLPTVVPAAGGPTLPPVGGLNLALAIAPAVILVGLVVGAGRGLRWPRLATWPATPRTTLAPPAASRPKPPPPAPSEVEPAEDLAHTEGKAPTRRGSLKSLAAGVRRLGSRAVGLASSGPVLLVAAAIIETAAVAMAVRLLVLGIRSGFL
jgi:hypothetical protein